jgi:hypothetical protein
VKFDDEYLDRALMALPLEEPPQDLRAGILAATLYRPAAMFSFAEIVAIGSLVAVILWLGVLIALGGAPLFTRSLVTIGATIVAALSSPSVLVWLAVGATTTFCLTLFTGSQPAYVHGRRAKRPDKP